MPNRYPIFMGDVPTYEVVNDLMHVKWRELELVMPINVMLIGAANAQAAIAKWRLEHCDNGDVVPIHGRKCG